MRGAPLSGLLELPTTSVKEQNLAAGVTEGACLVKEELVFYRGSGANTFQDGESL
jgi:hypothetical protein